MINIDRPDLLFQKQKLFIQKQAYPANDEPLAPAEVLLIYVEKSDAWKTEWEQMLNKLVLACGFDADKKMKLNIAAVPVVLPAIQQQVQPALILLFGDISLGKNTATIPLHYPVHLHHSVVIRTLELDKLLQDKTGKSQLWQALQYGLNLKK